MPRYEINYATILDCYTYVDAENISDALALFLNGEYDDYEVLNQDIDNGTVLITKVED